MAWSQGHDLHVFWTSHYESFPYTLVADELVSCRFSLISIVLTCVPVSYNLHGKDE
jgi:hypothetical protein